MADQRWIMRYALADEPVPDGWACRRLAGWHGSQGRVLHFKEVVHARATDWRLHTVARKQP
jgi:hypothetical protein